MRERGDEFWLTLDVSGDVTEFELGRLYLVDVATTPIEVREFALPPGTTTRRSPFVTAEADADRAPVRLRIRRDDGVEVLATPLAVASATGEPIVLEDLPPTHR